MTSPYIFEKTVSIKYDTVNFPSDTIATLIRPYSDLIVVSSNSTIPPLTAAFDPTQISVYYNGQEIGTTTTSKFYYSVAATSSGSNLSGFTLTIYANSSFTSPGYVGQTPYALSIGPNDLFFLNYTYTIYM